MLQTPKETTIMAAVQCKTVALTDDEKKSTKEKLFKCVTLTLNNQELPKKIRKIIPNTKETVFFEMS